MPLDYEAIIAPFRTAYFLQRRSISESLRKIAEWMTKRLKETQERERATRAFQTFSFSGDALSVWIDTSQHGALGPETEPPPASFGEGVAAPFKAFWRGLLLAPRMVEAENALPGLINVLADTVKMIVASLDRFKTPSKDMFDLSIKRSWQDLIGEIGLFFRVVNDVATLKQVKEFSAGGIELLDMLRRQFPSKPGDEKQTGGGMADIARWILGASLAIPLINQLLQKLGQTVNKVIRLKVIDRAGLILSQVFNFRDDVLNFLFVTLFGIGGQALEWLVVAQSEALSSLELYTNFLKTYLVEVRDWVVTLGKELKPFVNGMVRFLYRLGLYLEGLMTIDFGSAVSFGLISFTLEDVLEWRSDPSKARDKQQAIDDLIDDHPILTYLLKDRLLALREVIGVAAQWTPFGAEAAPPDLTGIEFPNLYDAFFTGPDADAMRLNLMKAGPSLKNNLNSIFDGGITALTNFGDEMSKAGTEAARVGPSSQYLKAADRAAKLAETAFGADAMRANMVRRKDPIATAFELWFKDHGFEFAGKVLPKFVAEMIEFWKKEASKPPAERPTSPHILARRAQIDRVRVPRLMIRVNEERELGKSLAVEVAARAQSGVAKAFNMATAQYGGAQ